MVVIRLSNDDFLRLGLQHSGFSNRTIDRVRNTTNIVRFMDKFYVTPHTCATIFEDIQSSDYIGDDAITKANPYQESRSEIETPYWMNQKKKRMKREAERRVVDVEDDVDFFDEPSHI